MAEVHVAQARHEVAVLGLGLGQLGTRLAHAGAAHGVPTGVPDLIGTLLARAEAAGHGEDGIAGIAETLRPATGRTAGAGAQAGSTAEMR